jgi:hypothetical protein
MPLPSPKRLPSARLLEAGLRAGRQMQVEPCEIPFAGAPEILRSEAYLFVRRNNEGPARRQGQRRRCLPAVGRGIFQQPAEIPLSLALQFQNFLESPNRHFELVL